MSLLVVGSIAFDTVSVGKETHQNLLGGSATYFSLAASYFSEVSMVGVVGEDFGEDNLDYLRNHGINTDNILMEKGKTFRWTGKYERDQINEAVTLNTELNVFANFKPNLNFKDHYYSGIFLANIDPTLQIRILDKFKTPNKLLIGFDTMNHWIKESMDNVTHVIKKSNIVIINEQEAIMITKNNNIPAALEKITNMGVQTVIVKLGSYGIIGSHKGNKFFLPAFPIQKVVDPTGAGDSFAGGFMGYLSKQTKKQTITELMIRQACVWGTVCASFCIQGFGTKKLGNLNQKFLEKRKTTLLELTQVNF